jgi:hypothetical protein
MTKAPRWKKKPIKNGIWEVEFFSWKYFHDYTRQEMPDFVHYVWRGQRDSSWKLESSLDRALKTKTRAQRSGLGKISSRETLENQVDPRDNFLVIAGYG